MLKVSGSQSRLQDMNVSRLETLTSRRLENRAPVIPIGPGLLDIVHITNQALSPSRVDQRFPLPKFIRCNATDPSCIEQSLYGRRSVPVRAFLIM
jgi:hypothetical protein